MWPSFECNMQNSNNMTIHLSKKKNVITRKCSVFKNHKSNQQLPFVDNIS